MIPGCRYKDKEVQRDAKMVSYKVVDKGTKPYVEVTISDEKKVTSLPPGVLITSIDLPDPPAIANYCNPEMQL